MPNAAPGTARETTYGHLSRSLVLCALAPDTTIREATDVLTDVVAYKGETLHQERGWRGSYWTGWECVRSKSGDACVHYYYGPDEPIRSWSWSDWHTVLRIAGYLLDSEEDLSADLLDDAEKWAERVAVDGAVAS